MKTKEVRIKALQFAKRKIWKSILQHTTAVLRHEYTAQYRDPLCAICPLEDYMKCKCGSYAINPHLYGRDKTDLDLCDVCYWRKRANSTQQLKAEILPLLTDALEEFADRKFNNG